MSQPQVSVVINTVNRAKFLEPLFTALREQSYKNFELIINPAPCTDNTMEILHHHAADIKIVPSDQISLCLQRNQCIANAAGEYILYLDDDALPVSKDWIANMVSAIEKDPQLAGVGGEVINYYSRTSEFKLGLTNRYGFQIFNTNAADFPKLLDKGFYVGVSGGNCMYRKSVLLDIGGYDTAFTYYLDETDVAIRVASAGYRIEYIEDAAILHYKDRSQGQLANKASTYRDWDVITRSDTYFVMKHARDLLPIRILKVLYYARKKHFVKERFNALKEKEITRMDLVRFLAKWIKGLISGFLLYFTHRPTRVQLAADIHFKQYPTNS